MKVLETLQEAVAKERLMKGKSKVIASCSYLGERLNEN